MNIMETNKKNDDWLADRVSNYKKEIKKYCTYYDVRAKFWESFLHLFNEDEQSKIFDEHELQIIKRLVFNCLECCNDDFGKAIISYRDTHWGKNGFRIEIKKEDGEGVFINWRPPFSIEKRTVIDYIECEQQYRDECILSLNNFEKNIDEIKEHLEKMKSCYQEIIDNSEKNRIERCFFEPMSFIEMFLERNG